MLYSYNNAYPQTIPERIRLSSGLTRTGKDYTEEELLDAGYKVVSEKPTCEETEEVQWNSTTGEWSIRQRTADEMIAINDRKWEAIRETRDLLLRESDWTQVNDAFSNKGFLAEDLKILWVQYRNVLRDVTNQSSPSAVTWPQPPDDAAASALLKARNFQNYNFLVDKGLINE